MLCRKLETIAGKTLSASTIECWSFLPSFLRVIRLVFRLSFFGACMIPLLSCNSTKNTAGGRSADINASTTNKVEVTIDSTTEHQVMEGFGSHHNSLVYRGLGDVLDVSLRTKAINTIYGDVGISMGNLQGTLLESPGTYGQRTNDNDNPFNINPDGFQTFSTKMIKEKLVDLAEPLGFNNYFLAQRINVRWASPWMKALRRDDYSRYLDEAAEQVVAAQIHWRDQYGIIPDFQMLFNEPLSGNGELDGGTTQEVVDLVKRVGDRLRSENFTKIKFVVPNEETVSKSIKTATAILSDPEARQYVGAIGYHTYPYGSVYTSIPRILKTSGVGKPDQKAIDRRQRLRELSKQYGVPLWMTEVSHGEVDPMSFDALRGRAIHIHDELIYASAAAYFGMNNMWDAISQQDHFGNNKLFSEVGNIILIDNKDKMTVYLTGMGYAIGHYARWIKKGAIRIEALSNDPLLQVTAFRDKNKAQVVMVIINNASTAKTVNISLKGLRLRENITGETSTASELWQPLTPFAPGTASTFRLTTPAESVITIMGQIDGKS